MVNQVPSPTRRSLFVGIRKHTFQLCSFQDLRMNMDFKHPVTIFSGLARWPEKVLRDKTLCRGKTLILFTI